MTGQAQWIVFAACAGWFAGCAFTTLAILKDRRGKRHGDGRRDAS